MFIALTSILVPNTTHMNSTAVNVAAYVETAHAHAATRWDGFFSNTRGCLTRFNKIATQGAPQMAVDKEANSLSRVYSYYSKFNLRLFYVWPALARYLSILFLNILTLLACTQSVDNLFHTLMVRWENEYFLTSNLLCFFTSV